MVVHDQMYDGQRDKKETFIRSSSIECGLNNTNRLTPVCFIYNVFAASIYAGLLSWAKRSLQQNS